MVQVLGKVIRLPKISSFVSDLSSIKHSLGLTVTLGSIVWVVQSWKIWEKGVVYLCPEACKKLNLGGKTRLLCSMQRSLVCSLLPRVIMHIQKPAIFPGRKNYNDHYSAYLSRIHLHIDQNVHKTFLPIVPFENYPDHVSLAPQLLQCLYSQTAAYLLCISVHTGFTLNLDFQRTSHFLTTLCLRVCFLQSLSARPDEIQAEWADASGSKLPSLSIQAGVRNSRLKRHECVCGTGEPALITAPTTSRALPYGQGRVQRHRMTRQMWRPAITQLSVSAPL